MAQNFATVSAAFKMKMPEQRNSGIPI